MFKKEGVTYEYHHIGIPTTESDPSEYYSSHYDVWSWDVKDSHIGAQMHRFGPRSCFHPLIKKYPHVALKVNSLEKAIEGEEVIMDIQNPIPGYRSVMINDGGLPVEFIETDLSYEEAVKKANSGESLMRDMT